MNCYLYFSLKILLQALKSNIENNKYFNREKKHLAIAFVKFTISSRIYEQILILKKNYPYSFLATFIINSSLLIASTIHSIESPACISSNFTISFGIPALKELDFGLATLIFELYLNIIMPLYFFFYNYTLGGLVINNYPFKLLKSYFLGSNIYIVSKHNNKQWVFFSERAF